MERGCEVEEDAEEGSVSLLSLLGSLLTESLLVRFARVLGRVDEQSFVSFGSALRFPSQFTVTERNGSPCRFWRCCRRVTWARTAARCCRLGPGQDSEVYVTNCRVKGCGFLSESCSSIEHCSSVESCSSVVIVESTSGNEETENSNSIGCRHLVPNKVE